MSQLVAWIGLVLVAGTSAYGLNVTAMTMLSSTAAAGRLTSSTTRREVLIVAVDPVTGDRAQMVCDAPANGFTGDTLLVNASDLSTISQVCNPPTVPDQDP
jgi:hypothetical protein